MTQSDRILNILQERGSEGVTNVELNRDLGIYRYGARIFDLRRAGYRIDSRQLRTGLWRFTLLRENAPAYPKSKFTLYDGLHGMSINL